MRAKNVKEHKSYGNGTTAPVGAGDQAAFRGGHGHVELAVVEQQGSCHAHGDGHVPNHILAAGTHHLRINTTVCPTGCYNKVSRFILKGEKYGHKQDGNNREVFQPPLLQHKLTSFDDTCASCKLRACTRSQSTAEGSERGEGWASERDTLPFSRRRRLY